MTAAPQLFSDSDSDEEKNLDSLTVNPDYARRFEHNKRREDLHRLADLEKRGLVSSSSDEVDDVALVSAKTDLQFFDALVKVKRKDPVIHRGDTKLYDSDDDEADDPIDSEGKKKRKGTEKGKTLYLKDVTAMHLLEDGPEFEENGAAIKSQAKMYSKEQEEIRRRFLEAAEAGEDEDDEEFFKERRNSTEDHEGEEDVEVRKKMDEYWGEDGDLDEHELFLKSFLMNKMWVGKGKEKERGAVDEEELSEDEDELEKQERYEAEYNFRYEEGVGDRVLGHSRVVEGSVRKKSNARKEQRKRKEERMSQAERERKEELKRLKNLKRREIEVKVEKIRAMAGITGECGIGEGDLEEEFDPEEYDRKMKEMFGEGYYEAEDADPGFGSGGEEDDLDKPDFDDEDELLGLPKGWDVIGTGEGFRTVRERLMKRKGEAKKEGEEENEVEEEEEDREDDKDVEIVDGDRQRERKRKRKHKIPLKEKVEFDRELEEYYKLDYEDVIGDLKTRFKYKSVPSNKFGLKTEEILMADDKELNQYVSLKKFAPYRQDEWKVHKMKKHQMLTKLYGPKGEVEHGKDGKTHRSKSSRSEESRNKMVDEVPNAETSGQDLSSRRSRRRRRLAELKLSQSRLEAYLKIPRNPKKQKKH